MHAALAGGLALTLTVAACGGGSVHDTSAANLPVAQPLSAPARLGERIFSDPTLSRSGRLSCASCHVPTSGHAPDNDLPAQFGGAALDRQGKRNAPSTNYLASNLPFSLASGAPVGGFLWDGRAESLQAQAAVPLLAADEMANGSKAEVIDKLSRAAYADEFKAAFGADIFSRIDDAFDRLTLALQAYQREDIDFGRYTSKYDEFLRGNVALGDQEARGLALFNSATKGNCQACHPSAKSVDGSFPLFTNFGYENLGVPRNAALVQNADPGHYDLGLCDRPDLAARTDLCGAFKVPTLRNVGLRLAFFHNGRFKSLKELLTFYAQRDTNPEKWYPLKADGSVDKFDDLPAPLRGNVTVVAPYNRIADDTPGLSDSEIDDLIAFLQTLTDGYRR